MSFFRPPVNTLRDRRVSDFEYELGSQNARIPRTVEHALAVSGAGTAHGLHGRLDWIAKNAFPQSAEDERLVQMAAFFGVFQKAATRATGLVQLLGSPGSVVPAGSVVIRSDGFEYATLATIVLVGFTLSDRVEAQARLSGAAGNGVYGDMHHQVPVLGVNPIVSTVGGMTGGTNVEDFVSLRSRLMERLASPPGGGKKGDYIRWAKQVAGVTRAWEYPWVPKIGNVTVVFMRDNDDTTPFPDLVEQALVAAEMKLYAPIGLPAPIAIAPNDRPLVLQIALTVEAGADPVTVRAAIVKSIQDMLATRAVPAAADGTPFYRSWISEAISPTPGEKDHKLLAPAVDVVLAKWDLVTLKPADVTWP